VAIRATGSLIMVGEAAEAIAEAVEEEIGSSFYIDSYESK